MGYRRGWGPDLNRSFRAGSKIADDITKGILLGGLAAADYAYRKSKQTRSSYGRYQMYDQREIEELEMQLASPFKFTKAIIWHSIASLFALAFPILGAYLYCYEDWWMFFSVLICGMLELCLLVPTSMLFEDNMKCDWIFDATKKDKQIKQIKILLWLSIVTNIILVVLNSYPFIVYYEGGILVTLMTLCLYFANGSCIYMNVRELKNINVRFEQNVNKFRRLQGLKDISKDKEQTQQSSGHSETTYSGIKQIQSYIDKCNSDKISLDIIKANIRILNAMTDSYKRGYSELNFKIIEQQLGDKISLAKRDFVKRECRLALEILNMLKTQSIDDVIATLKQRYPL